MPGTEDTEMNGIDIVFVLSELTSLGWYLSLTLHIKSSCAFVKL